MSKICEKRKIFGAKYHKSKWGLMCSIWPGLMTELVIYETRITKYVQGLDGDLMDVLVPGVVVEAIVHF